MNSRRDFRSRPKKITDDTNMCSGPNSDKRCQKSEWRWKHSQGMCRGPGQEKVAGKVGKTPREAIAGHENGEKSDFPATTRYGWGLERLVVVG